MVGFWHQGQGNQGQKYHAMSDKYITLGRRKVESIIENMSTMLVNGQENQKFYLIELEAKI